MALELFFVSARTNKRHHHHLCRASQVVLGWAGRNTVTQEQREPLPSGVEERVAGSTARGLRCTGCAARGLVAFARCRRRHAFDGGIFRVGFFLGLVQLPYVQLRG